MYLAVLSTPVRDYGDEERDREFVDGDEGRISV